MLGRDNEIQQKEILELQKVSELEDDNTLLTHDLTTTAETRGEYTIDTDRSINEIIQLQSEIMTLLENMGVKKSQRPSQENFILLDNSSPIVVPMGCCKPLPEDGILQQENEGSRTTMVRSYKHLMQYVNQREVFQHHRRLIIEFYTSIGDLGKSCFKSKIIRNPGIWCEFANSFAEVPPLYHFIDFGDDWVEPEHKINDPLGSSSSHRKCQGTVLVRSQDQNYTRLLRQCIRHDDSYSQAAVLEAVSTPGKLSVSSSRVPLPQKDDLFQSAKTLVSSILLAIPRRPGSSCIQPFHSEMNTNASPSLNLSLMPKPKKVFNTVGPRLQSTKTQPHEQRKASKMHSSSSQSQLVPARTRKPFTTPDRFIGLDTQAPRTGNRPVSLTPPTDTQTHLPRLRNTFFDSNGQRVNSKTYVDIYIQRYLQC